LCNIDLGSPKSLSSTTRNTVLDESTNTTNTQAEQEEQRIDEPSTNSTSNSTSFTVRQAKVVARSLNAVVDKDKAKVLIDRVEKVTHGMYWRSRFLQYHLLRLLEENKLPDEINKIEWIYHALACNNRWGKPEVIKHEKENKEDDDVTTVTKTKEKPIQNEYIEEHVKEWNEKLCNEPIAQLSTLKWQGPQEWVFELHTYGTVFKNYHTYALRDHHVIYLAKKYGLKKGAARKTSERMFEQYKGKVQRRDQNIDNELIVVEDKDDDEGEIEEDDFVEYVKEEKKVKGSIKIERLPWYKKQLEHIQKLKTLYDHVKFHHYMLVEVSKCSDPVTWPMAPLTQYRRRFIRIDRKGARQLRILSRNGELKDVFKNEKVTRSLGESFMTDGLQIHIMYTKEKTVTIKKNQNDKKRTATQMPEGEDPKPNKRIYKAGIEDSKYKHKKFYEPGSFNFEDNAKHGLYGVKTTLPLAKVDVDNNPTGGANLVNRSIPNNMNIVAIDPGHGNILTCSIRRAGTTKFVKHYTLSKRQYYDMLGTRYDKKTREDRKNKVPAVREAETQQSTNPLGIIDSALYLKHIQVHATHYPLLSKFYGSQQEGRRRFWSYQKKQKAIEHIMNSIAPNPNTVIAFGGAKFAVTWKGMEATPVRALLKELSRRRKVILIDEYHTTKMSYCCESETEVYKGPVSRKKLMTWMNRQYEADKRKGIERERHKYDFSRVHNLEKILPSTNKQTKRQRHETITPETAYPYETIHGLRQCQHCARYLNRDMNAAKNIGECFVAQYTTGIRHESFVRQPKSTRNQLLDHDTEQHGTAVPEIKKRKLSRIEPSS
jgi:hypothetical protein